MMAICRGSRPTFGHSSGRRLSTCTVLPSTDIGGLSAELTAKLTRSQPGSLGAASRIQGMTPAALAAIAAHVRKRRGAGRGVTKFHVEHAFAYRRCFT